VSQRPAGHVPGFEEVPRTAFHRPAPSLPRRWRSVAGLALCLALFEPALGALPRQAELPAQAPLEFEADLDSALSAAKRTGMPVVVIFGAMWCGPCRVFGQHTLEAPEVRELGPSFHWVYVDIDSNVSLARDYEVEATPFTVVLAADGTKLTAAAGAFEPATYRAFLGSVLSSTDQDPGHLLELESERPTRLTWTPKGYRAQAMCFSQIGYGPLSLPSQAPGQVLRLQLQPRTPSTLARGQYELSWTETFANIFAFEENDFRLDYLTLNSTLTLSYGISDSVQVDLALGNLLRTDSYLDPVTNTFHDLFGLGDSGRDDFPAHDNVIDLELRDGIEIEDRSSGTETTHLALTLQHNLTCGTKLWPALAYSVSGRWDAGGDAELEGSSPFSAGISGSAARRLGESFYGYLGLSYNWYGLDESRGLPLVDEQWGALAALEWSYRANRSFVLQYLVSEGVALDRDPFDDSTHEINLGWKCEISLGTVLEIGLIENMINVDNSPDFGLHFGIKHRF
jgi:thiol-disulfide isomerase/thioredoxin